jgi:hypothetical protein
MIITLTREEAQQVLDDIEAIAKADYRHWQELASLGEFERWARSRANHIAETLRARLAEPVVCARCGEVNPAEIHTCTPKEQEPWQVIPESVGTKRLTEMKAKNIIDRDGFVVCGYVMDADDKICIVHHSAVRWLSSDEMFRVMHTDAASPQPEKEQEPVAWLYYHDTDDGRPILSHVKQNFVETEPGWIEKPLYTAPPQSEWQGLTDEELDEAEQVGAREYRRWKSQIRGQIVMPQDRPEWHIHRAIEAKLKEKNT